MPLTPKKTPATPQPMASLLPLLLVTSLSYAQCTNPVSITIQTASANLLCASSLPGCQNPGLEDSLSTIQDWAQRVGTETERHLYRFRKAPSEFENSEGFFRMLMLTVFLQEDFGVHYDEAMKSSPSSASPQDDFFSRPDLVFL